jgi:putative redox protein
MGFQSSGPSGNAFAMDAVETAGGRNQGPTPVEAMMGALAACTGIDILTILAKKRMSPTNYRLEVEYVKEAGDWPRPVTSAIVTHYLEGPDLDPLAVAQAVQLSEEKYCSVSATLKISVEVRARFAVNGSSPEEIESE